MGEPPWCARLNPGDTSTNNQARESARYKVSNQVTLIGRLGTDPKISGDENPRAYFSLATHEEFGRGEDRTERTDWHGIVCWRGLVKSCEHLAAGDRVAVAGKLRSQDWADSSGRKRRSIEVHADDIVFLDLKAFGSDENLAT